MNRSRLSRRLQKKKIKSLILSVLGIVIIIFAIIKFGIPLLLNISLFISDTKNQESSPKKKNSFISPPIINSEYDATNSAQIKISGTSSSDYTIDLYINGNLVDKTDTKQDGAFSFDTILSPGENIINAKAIATDGKESSLSEDLKITFKNKPPSLEVNSPIDGQLFSKDQNTTEIKGTTDPHVRVTINNFWAVIGENNNFSYTLTLRDGDNEIKIEAQDQAGNKTEKNLNVRYSP